MKPLLLALCLAACLQRMSEEYFGVVIVTGALENRGIFGEYACVRRIDAPSGKRPGQCDNVLLRVSAIGAERVQFHDLAREILVQSFLPAAGAGASRRGA